MSWGTTRKGTKSEVREALTKDFDGFATSYPPGTNEGDDVALVRARAFTLLDALDVTPHAYYDGEQVEVSAHGSHSWSGSKESPHSAELRLHVKRVPAPQKS